MIEALKGSYLLPLGFSLYMYFLGKGEHLVKVEQACQTAANGFLCLCRSKPLQIWDKQG
jgi:hypothetical protein